MKSKIFLLAILSFFSILYYCNCDRKLSTEPEAAKYEPGSRNYIWELDTLDMPINHISSVWGAAPNDVWAVGAGGTPIDRLLHYDGEKWSTYTNEPIMCDGFCLYGFSANDVWMGGQAGWGVHGAGIWHFDGVQWSSSFVYDIPEAHFIEVENIWGDNPNDVYACGVIGFFDGINSTFQGFVLHYNGTIWKELVRANFESQFLKVIKNKDVYIQSYTLNIESLDREYIEIYKINANKLEKIYSNHPKDIVWANFNQINEITYFIIGKIVYKYLKNQLVEYLSFENYEFNYGISGRNENDLFIGMKNGIAHYNGRDIEYLYYFPNSRMSQINDPVIFKKEVFFCISNPSGTHNSSNLILHCKIEEEGE